MVPLLPEPADHGKHRDFRVTYPGVPLGVQIRNDVGQPDCSPCPPNACAAVHDGLLLGLRREEHQREKLPHRLETLQGVSAGHPVVWPSRVVNLYHLPISVPQHRVAQVHLANDQIFRHLYLLFVRG